MRCATIWVVLGCCGLTLAQDAALKDRVSRLIDGLAAAKPDDRDVAEKALVGLGPRALPLLPAELPKSADANALERLERVRKTLEGAEEKLANQASRITIQGQALRLSEVLRLLQQQSGNTITDMREAYGGEASNPALDFDIKDKPFFEALDEIVSKAGIALNFYTGDGSIGLMPMTDGYGAPATTAPEAMSSKPLVKVVGPYRVVFKRIGITRDLATGQSRANAQFEVAWEPRLRPMLLGLKSEELEIVDDRDQKVAPEVTQESMSTVLRPENPVAEVNLNLMAPDRKAGALKLVKVRGEVTLPAGMRRFRFPKLDQPNVSQTQGDVKMTLDSIEVDENVWHVLVRLEMPGEGPAFDSYRQGLFNNQIWLQKADGSRFEHNGGFNTVSVAPGKLGFEYLFVDAPGKPGDYQLVYETPSRVVTVPIEFTFENVPLP